MSDIFNSMGVVLKELQISELLRTNDLSGKYGLMLTEKEVKEIIAARNQVLRSYGRIELDMEVTRKLILEFCTSSFINQEDYASTLKDLQEVFYYMKNETEDKLGDDELIAVIKNFFEKDCGGSVELLRGRELEVFARGLRRGRKLPDGEGGEPEWPLKLPKEI